jgi:hypothetical protein
MYLIEWHIVDGGFSGTEELKGAKGEGASLGGQRCVVKDFADGGQGAAVFAIVMAMVRVGMVVRRVGITIADQDAGFARGDTAAIHGFEAEGCAEIERGGGLLEERGGNTGIDESAEEHVSTQAGEAFEIADAHDDLL